MKKVQFAVPLLLAALVTTACSDGEVNNASEHQKALVEKYIKYDKSDFYTEWQSSIFTKITLNQSKVKVDGVNEAVVLVEDNTVTIKGGGNYVLEGEFNGQVVVDSEDKEAVRLILNGVSIQSDSSAAIYVSNAEKTIVLLEEGTENTLIDATSYASTDEPAGTLYSKDDLTINGEGKLTVTGQYEDGIVGKDKLIITGGEIIVDAVDDAIRGRDLLAIRDGKITTKSGGDSLKASNDTDEGKGHVVIEGGQFNLTSAGDGIQSERDVLIVDGNFQIVAGDGSPEVVESNEEFPGGGFGGMGMNNSTAEGAGGMMNGIDMDFMRKLMEQTQAADFDLEEFIANLDESELPEGMTLENLKQMIESMPKRGEEGMEPSQRPGNMKPPGAGNAVPPTGQMPGNMEPPLGDENPVPPTGQLPSDMTPPTRDEQVSGQGNEATDTTQQTNETSAQSEEEENGTSTKGIKAVEQLHIVGGTFVIDTLDDALHSDGDITIEQGDVTITTGDDAIHADQNLLIEDGQFNIKKGLEGYEGKVVKINGGNHNINVTDDGINATTADSSSMAVPGRGNTGEVDVTSAEALIQVNGGTINVRSQGDGIDSNDILHVTRGSVQVTTVAGSPDSAFDFDGGFVIDGGTVIGTGSSQMANGTASNSKQPAILMTLSKNMKANTAFTIANEKGEAILSATPSQSYNSIFASSSDLQDGETYVLIVDDVEVTFTIEGQMVYLDENGVTEQPSTMNAQNRMPWGQ